MIAAAAALFGSEILLGGRAYVVRPPAVVTALAVEAALEHGGTETTALLAEACAGPDALGRPWMPPSMRSVLFSPAVLPKDRARVIQTAMLAGVPDERLEAARRAQEEAREEARASSWSEVLARYRATFSPGDVLAEPWPFFLAQSEEIRRERARAAVDWANAYAGVRTGGEAWASLLRVAGFEPPKPGRQARDERELEEARATQAKVRAQRLAMEAYGDFGRWSEFIERSPVRGEA